MKIKTINDIQKILIDHEKRISQIEKPKEKGNPVKSKEWYRPGSTIEKVVLLINEGFFNKTKTITELIAKLKSKDYHMNSSDLTLPMRKIVRKGLLEKTKTNSDNSVSKVWVYVKSKD